MTARPIFFVSDAHLLPTDGPASPVTRDLHALLDRAASTAGALYVLGDLFDFWFEYRGGGLRHYLPTLTALAAVARAGVPVTFVPGNHDYWAGAGLASYGVRVRRGPIRATLHGRAAVLAHGDGLGVREPWTRAFQGIVRSRGAIAAFRLIPPDAGVAFALGLSRISRRFSGHRAIDVEAVRRRVEPALALGGADLVVLGHYHQPTHLTGNGRDFALIADFQSRRSYARLDDGVLSLRRWPD